MFCVIDKVGPLEGLTEDEALIVRFSRELFEEKTITDKAFDDVRARWGKKGLTEIVALMGVYMMNATILRAMGHRTVSDARHLTPRN